jgi:type IV secretory pathway protease TraF
MRRFGWVMTTCFATLLVRISAHCRPVSLVLWNVSASVPIGFYFVSPAGTLQCR